MGCIVLVVMCGFFLALFLKGLIDSGDVVTLRILICAVAAVVIAAIFKDDGSAGGFDE